MDQKRIQVFDPPMCCSSGVCGPNIDPKLIRFSSDLDWLQEQGVAVERFSLSITPALYAQTEVVRTALESDGIDCLPLLVVDGQIVQRGSYPTRSQLAGFCGIDKATARKPKSSAVQQRANEAAACGPDCSCHAPVTNRRSKVAISVIALLAVAGILVYKATVGGASDAASGAGASESGFAVTSQADVIASEEPTTAQGSIENESQTAVPMSTNLTAQGADAETKALSHKASFGEYLDSIAALDTVAVNNDAVFIYVPAKNEEGASDPTRSAVLAAQKTLSASGVKVGLYTLSTSARDFAVITAQVQLPAILVACKGRGASTVTGEVTETKLIQAYMASASSGGCGPSGCGPSGCN